MSRCSVVRVGQDGFSVVLPVPGKGRIKKTRKDLRRHGEPYTKTGKYKTDFVRADTVNSTSGQRMLRRTLDVVLPVSDKTVLV